MEKMENKFKVVIGRKWNNPEIYTTLTSEGICLGVSPDNLVKALVREVVDPAFFEELVRALAQTAGNPTFLVTTAGLEKALLTALQKLATDTQLPGLEQALLLALPKVLTEVKRASQEVV